MQNKGVKNKGMQNQAMQNKAPPTVICPHCGKEQLWDTSNHFRPFCSERCKLIDLGKWASEDYRVAQPTDEPEFADFFRCHLSVQLQAFRSVFDSHGSGLVDAADSHAQAV